jgi:hypothetical protein
MFKVGDKVKVILETRKRLAKFNKIHINTYKDVVLIVYRVEGVMVWASVTGTRGSKGGCWTIDELEAA